MKTNTRKPKILFISTLPPTACGIATYTTDLINGINTSYNNHFGISTCCITKTSRDFHLCDYAINPHIKQEYREVALAVNRDLDIHLIHIQHEFGLFGGSYGSNIFSFLESITKPVVITFHTVLPNPNEDLKEVVQKIARNCKKIVIMTRKSEELLQLHYHIPIEKIARIPHGTHLVQWQDLDILKQKLGLTGKTILSTFGLLGPGKGIETSLMALPAIIAEYPQVIFLILGSTHPNNFKNGKDEYRDTLVGLVETLAISQHVIFINRYLILNELLEYLQATDIYLFTSNDPNQAVSGTFAYAMSCACPIIATSVSHTREELTTDLGKIIEIGDHGALAKHTIDLLANGNERQGMGLNALQKTRESTWQNVALKHVFLYQQLVGKPSLLTPVWPAIKMTHLQKMTTEIGIIQFSKITIPDLESGFTLDDNARALIVFCRYYERWNDETALFYIDIYLSFVTNCQKDDGTFINYVDKNKKNHIKNDYVNLEDSNARALWALGTVLELQHVLPNSVVFRASTCFFKSAKRSDTLLSPRAIAFAIKGLYSYYLAVPTSWVKNTVDKLAGNLISKYDLNTEKDWNWYEEYLTYANSILPEAMLCAYLVTKKESYKYTAIDSFHFLLSKMFQTGTFRVISNKGWHIKGETPNQYGEQPIDVAYTIETLALFYQTFSLVDYKYKMNKAFNWFLGDNHLMQIMYDPHTGGCHDGLEEYGVNLNQGAESSICFLMARLTIERANQANHGVEIPKQKKSKEKERALQI